MMAATLDKIKITLMKMMIDMKIKMKKKANVNIGEDVNQQNERDNNLNEGDIHAMDIAINN